MKTRLMTAGIIIAVLIPVVYFNIFFINYIIIGGIFAFAFMEALALYSLRDEKYYLLTLAVAFYLPLYFASAEGALASTLAYSMFMLASIASYLAYKKADNLDILKVFIYPVIPMFVIFGIYRELGISYLVWLVVIVALSDSGAYFIGRKYGKTPFSPTSPKKTLEGLAGGIFFSLIGSFLFGIIFLHLPIFNILVTTILVATLGIFGDLFESYLKRKANVKDSGTILPGHGGILDRMDGYLFGCFGMVLVNLWSF